MSPSPATTATAPDGANHAAAPSLAVRARDLLTCEWTKFRSVRSTYWTLAVAVVTPIAFSVLVAVTLAAAPAHGAPPDPLLPGLLSLEYAAIAVAVLGVLAFSSEFGTGLIRTTFAAAPRRRAVLAAKAAVTGTVTLIAGEAVAFVSFFAVQAVLSGHHFGVSLSRPGVPGAVLAEGLLLCVCALLGVALGAIIRHTAGGIAATLGLILVPGPASAAGSVRPRRLAPGPAGLARRRPAGRRPPDHPPRHLTPRRRSAAIRAPGTGSRRAG
jgi:ABC-2 type transport system permease protein